MFLRQVANPVVRTLDKEADFEQEDFISSFPLYAALIREDWKDAKQMIKDDDQGSLPARNAAIMAALQVAVGAGKGVHFIEKLVEHVGDEDLVSLVDNHGNTVLGIAATLGYKAAAVSIVRRVPLLLYIPNIFNNFPAHIAARFSHKDTLQCLLSASRDHPSVHYCSEDPYGSSVDGLRLLTDIIDADFIDVALDLVEKNPDLARMTLPDDTSALKKIVGKKSVFFSRRDYTFWDCIISYCKVPSLHIS